MKAERVLVVVRWSTLFHIQVDGKLLLAIVFERPSEFVTVVYTVLADRILSCLGIPDLGLDNSLLRSTANNYVVLINLDVRCLHDLVGVHRQKNFSSGVVETWTLSKLGRQTSELQGVSDVFTRGVRRSINGREG